MSLLFCDGFDHYDSASLMARKWTAASGWSFTTGRFGGSCIRKPSGSAPSASIAVTAASTLIIGFAFRAALLGSQESRICALLDGVTLQDELYFKTDGKLEVRRNGTVLATAASALSTATWYYIEWKVTISDASGVSEVVLNGNSGSPIISFSGDTKNTSNSTADSVAIQTSNDGGGQTIDWDDFYICNSSGSLNNAYLGDVRIKTVFPDGAGNYAEWTPSAGSNYQNVDENPPDDDTTYNSSATANQRDTYSFSSLAISGGSVKAAVINMQVRKDDGGSRSIASLCRSSSTDGVGSTQSVPSSYINMQGIYETDPATSAAWASTTAVDNAEFGQKVIS